MEYCDCSGNGTVQCEGCDGKGARPLPGESDEAFAWRLVPDRLRRAAFAANADCFAGYPLVTEDSIDVHGVFSKRTIKSLLEAGFVAGPIGYSAPISRYASRKARESRDDNE